jgi:hypothetical protein
MLLMMWTDTLNQIETYLKQILLVKFLECNYPSNKRSVGD